MAQRGEAARIAIFSDYANYPQLVDTGRTYLVHTAPLSQDKAQFGCRKTMHRRVLLHACDNAGPEPLSLLLPLAGSTPAFGGCGGIFHRRTDIEKLRQPAMEEGKRGLSFKAIILSFFAPRWLGSQYNPQSATQKSCIAPST